MPVRMAEDVVASADTVTLLSGWGKTGVQPA